MLQIVFKNLEYSELAKYTAQERIETVLERFPDLKNSRITITLGMENSPVQAGPDLFTVKFYCHNGRYRRLVMEKSAGNLYAALADVVDHLLEKLNRLGDKSRVKEIKKARRLHAAVGAPE